MGINSVFRTVLFIIAHFNASRIKIAGQVVKKSLRTLSKSILWRTVPRFHSLSQVSPTILCAGRAKLFLSGHICDQLRG